MTRAMVIHIMAVLWTLAVLALTSYPILELTAFRASLDRLDLWSTIVVWGAYLLGLLVVYGLAVGRLKNLLWPLAVMALTIYPVIDLSRYISAYHGIFPLDAFLVELGLMWLYYMAALLIVFTLVIVSRQRAQR